MIDVGARMSSVRAPVMRVIAHSMLESARRGAAPMPERIVVVTGSSGGIGSAIVDRFTAAGDAVVGLDLLDGVDVSQPGDCAAATPADRR